MFWNIVTLLFLLSPIAVVYHAYKTHKMWERCRCAHYCWQTMADFAGESFGEEDGRDEGWKEVVHEHREFMRKFGLDIVSDQNRLEYELELLRKGLPILKAHKDIFF